MSMHSSELSEIQKLELEIQMLKMIPIYSTNSIEGLIDLADFFLEQGQKLDSAAHEVAGLTIRRTAIRLRVYMD